MKILFIKLTSLGDLIHALPALTDAKKKYPNLEVDWVVHDSFKEIPLWHPAVKETFISNHRKWRKNFFSLSTVSSLTSLLQAMRKNVYDLVIDGQGNFKTALLALNARGVRVGYDKDSIREKIASIVYQKKCSVSWKLSAIERLRHLFAEALDYSCPNTFPDFQIRRDMLVPPLLPLPSSYVVFVHGASWETKLWPEVYWKELIQLVAAEGFSILLPWGTPEEEARAKRLSSHSQAIVLPRLSLSQLGGLMLHAKACVGLDTGISHLAMALGTPSLRIYGSSHTVECGGVTQVYLQSKLPCVPCHKKTCRFPSNGLHPPCLGALTPELAFNELQKLLSCKIDMAVEGMNANKPYF